MRTAKVDHLPNPLVAATSVNFPRVSSPATAVSNLRMQAAAAIPVSKTVPAANRAKTAAAPNPALVMLPAAARVSLT